MYKGQEAKNVKAYNKFSNDPRKMCFEHKTIMKVDYRIKKL
jgi:phenylalanine-4-hydroxylase